MWIAVDVDNTVANTNLELVRRFGVSLKKYPAPEVPPGFFCTEEGLRLLQRAEPFPRAAETLKTLAELGYRIAYVSSRPGDALFLTVRWLQKHGFPADQVLCGLDRQGKAEVATKELQAVAVFEDDPVLAAVLLAHVPALWLKDWPYNRKLPAGKGAKWNADRVIRFRAWSEVLKAVVTSNPDLAALIGKKGE
ncbi:hypothetical protein D7024_01270 [Desulfofundulus salinus]|uniref:Uncharacterized protein n=1 Tax=Desulfofundulus salinus TaxID=2419843 RepID=A0A494WSB5_9FIRM|nr:hypothetical protein [Desulfofundulus salinum]RKO65731.1 hypothetical protein D7024_01270 [Desulfofundulus salinum]